ncbi:hypothetical protein MTBBW1_1670056 [Desulfamplus magnetovallimortis]|uniref:Uncharacterized protein n=1 Tax=Desulfamplus magnetovallimortis TaxID=1246637 RepID=A0A1W1H974_9BACT|nr:hypothetical protein MTBBW1_1670056 [Desulfamplus magnetovallimortis]
MAGVSAMAVIEEYYLIHIPDKEVLYVSTGKGFCNERVCRAGSGEMSMQLPSCG